MTGSPIIVALRCRPLLKNEVPAKPPLVFLDNSHVTFKGKEFSYDFVFPEKTSNGSVYKMAVEEKISRIFEGYNVTILAYGSTGSGKTYTMGTNYVPDCQDMNKGIIPLGLTEIFRVLESEKENKDFTVKVTFIELYQEVIYDLCHPNAKHLLTSKYIGFQEKNQPQILQGDGSFKVSNLVEKSVNSIDEALDILSNGCSIRHTSSTAKNTKSSRSHAIFTVLIEQLDKKTNEFKSAKFQLVDLAGSERMDTSQTQGLQVKEATKINLSLLTLGRVIQALTENQPLVPYRDSVLTKILQDSLGGNSYTLMIACVNPSSSEETRSTLRYSYNARMIKNEPKVNKDTPAVQIEKLKKLVDSLTADLFTAQNQGKVNCDGEYFQLLQNAYSEINDLNLRIIKLEEKEYSTKEKLKYVYENIKDIATGLKTVGNFDDNLKVYVEKLEKIQCECLQLMVQENTELQIDETAEEYLSCESVLPIEVEAEIIDSEDPLASNKTEDELKEELKELNERKKTSAKLLEVLDSQIKLKEDEAKLFQLTSPVQIALAEGNINSLNEKIKNLMKDIDDLQQNQQKDKKSLEERQCQIRLYEAEIKKMEEERRTSKKSLQALHEAQVQNESLKREILAIKKSRVEISKKLKETNSIHARIQQQLNKTVATLTKENLRKEAELSKVKNKFEKQIKILKAKYEQAMNCKKSLQAMTKKKPCETEKKKTHNLESFKEMIDDEIRIAVCNITVKDEVEGLEKVAESLKEQIKTIKQLSPDEAKEKESNDEKELRLQVQLKEVEELKQTKEVDQSAKPCTVFDDIKDLEQAKSIIQHLFKKCITTTAENLKQMKLADENLKTQQEASNDEVEILNTKIKHLENKISTLMRKYETQLQKTIIEYEKKSLELLKSHDTKLKEKLEAKDSELVNVKSSNAKKRARLDQLHQESSSQSMMEEYLSGTDEETSFSNDANDPDWRLTPMHKQLKRRRLETKAETMEQADSESSLSSPMDTAESEAAFGNTSKIPYLPCTCEGDCKTKRCKCQKRNVTCTKACSCNSKQCFNMAFV